MSGLVIKRPVRPGTAFSRVHALVPEPTAPKLPSPVAGLRVIKPARPLPGVAVKMPITPEERDLPRRAAEEIKELPKVHKMVGLASAILAVLGLLVLLVPRTAQAGDFAPAVAETGLSSMTVEQGQSLWEIAVAIAPHRDTRDVVSEIMKINHLTETRLYSGQHLELPVINQ